MIRYLISLFCAVFLLAAFQELRAQHNSTVSQDSVQALLKNKIETAPDKPSTTPQKKVKNPSVAGWLSATMPGAGQIYNGKIWKVPIVYGAFATTSYLIVRFNNRYEEYKVLYGEATEDNEKDAAKQGMIFYQRYRDMNIIVTVLIYALNIIDASVDAHLSDFDVEDNLSLTIQPTAFRVNRSQAIGLSCSFRF